MKKLRIAAVGTGNMARQVHGPSWQTIAAENSDVELVCAVDRDLERATAYARDFGYTHAADDVETMLRDFQPDAVTIAVNVEVNATIAATVLRHGIPALCEKPPALNAAELDTLLAAIRRPDGSIVPHQVAYNRRYTPLVTWFQQQRSVWEQEAPFRFCRCDFHRDRRYDRDFSTTMVHGFDLVKFLLGSTYRRGTILRQGIVPEQPWVVNTLIAAEMANGCIGQLNFCPSAGDNAERYTLVSETRTVTLELPCTEAAGSGTLLVESSRAPGGERLAPPADLRFFQRFFQSGFYQENQSFLEHVRCGGPFPNDFLEAADLVMLMTGCREGDDCFAMPS